MWSQSEGKLSIMDGRLRAAWTVSLIRQERKGTLLPVFSLGANLMRQCYVQVDLASLFSETSLEISSCTHRGMSCR